MTFLLTHTPIPNIRAVTHIPSAAASAAASLIQSSHPANANRVLAFSLFGEVYSSEDAGESWRKITREFGEIRAIAWLPN